MSQLSNAPAPTGGEQAIMEALQKLSEQVQRFQDNLTTHTSQMQGLGIQMQGMHQEQSAQFQGLAVQLQKIHEEQSAQFQSLDERFENIHKSLVEGFRDASESFRITSSEMVWEQSVGHARAHNLAARDTPYRRIYPKPGKPAYDESDFPANAFKVPFMPEDSCDRLARAWGIEFVEGVTLDQKRGEVGRFIGCHTPW